MAVTLDSLKKTVGKKKVKSMAFAWLADYENQAGDSTTALARVDAGLQLYPGDIPGMLVRSKLLFQLGDFEECVKECERILQKEPFCLSAQKRMGDAYEKLENIDERNRCYRRVHDMDPLDTFWKEEYEAVPETAVGAAAVAGAAALGDADFAMPDMEGVGDNGSEPAESVEESVATNDVPSEEKAEDSLFSKSLDMDIDSATAETSTDSTSAASGKENPFASPFSADSDEDPFASLAGLGGEDSLVDESAMDSLQQSLESAMESNAADVTLDQDMPEGEEISGNDVNSAFSSLFGDEDELDTPDEASGASSSPFAQMDLPTSLDDDSDTTEKGTQSVLGDESLEQEQSEDKPQSIDDAFGDIFGEDELPEELPASKPAPKAEPDEELKPEEDTFSGGMFEKSAAADMGLGAEEDLKLEEPEPAKDADKPQSLDSAFADIFGEDELPEEKPAEPAAPTEDAGLELPADSLELPAEEPASTPTDDASLELPSLDDSTSALTDGMDLEMPSEEKPAEETPAESLDTFDIANWSPDAKPADDSTGSSTDSPVEDIDLKLPAEEPAEEPSLELPAEEETPAEPAVEEPALEVPAEESVVDEPAQEKPAEESADEGFSVDKAFDALFADDDELPEEKSAETASAEPETADKITETAEPETEETAGSDKEDLDKEMGAAFSSLFAEDDDLPVENAKPEVETTSEVSQEDTGAVLEEAPLADAALESDLDKSFSSLFGEDDSLDESDLKPATEASANDPAIEQPEVAAPTEGGAKFDNSLESEFSGAFKQLFDTDDDSLDEKEDIPSNKGVDFLMSGDSDDEVSAGLVKDPTIPLDKLPMDLDESLNTSTLAEIYFEQGHYDKAIDIYQDLARKEPENESIRKRLEEIETAYRNKFGGEQNG